MTRFLRTNGFLLLGAMMAFFLCVGTAIAQPPDEEGKEFDDFNFDSILVEQAELRYIGFGGGYLGMVSFVNYDQLNTLAVNFGMEQNAFSGPMLLGGGGGFVGGVIPNTRLGVYAVGGTKEVSSEVAGTNGQYERTMRYSAGVIAAQLEYAFFLPADGLMFFPGVMVGRSSSEIELNQTRTAGVPFTNIFDPERFNAPAAAADSLIQYAHIARNSLHLQPTVTVDFAFNSYVLLRGGAGYGLNFGGTWTDPSGTEISDVPDVSADGLNVHFGLFVGLFQK